MKKYFHISKIAFLNTFEYRGDIVSNMLMYLIGIGASFFLWDKLIRDNTIIGEYDLGSIMTYYLLTGLFIGFFNDRTAKHFEKWIQSGGLSTMLIKPYKIILNLFFKELGSRISTLLLIQIFFLIPIIVIPGIRQNITFTPGTFFWLITFSILVNIFLYLFYWVLGSFSFWMIHTGGLRNVIGNIIYIIKGHWFPLDLAPLWFQNILSLLPFQYAMFYPIKILTNTPSTQDNVKGILVLFVSIAICGLLARFLWERGLRKYNSVGM